jgi:hypothetical protein
VCVGAHVGEPEQPREGSRASRGGFWH